MPVICVNGSRSHPSVRSRGSSATRLRKSPASGSIIVDLGVEVITNLAGWSNRTVVHETAPVRDERSQASLSPGTFVVGAGGQRVVQVRDQVVGVLYASRVPHERFRDAHRLALEGARLDVARRGGGPPGGVGPPPGCGAGGRLKGRGE